MSHRPPCTAASEPGPPAMRFDVVSVVQHLPATSPITLALVAQHKPRVLALDMSRVPDLEYSALQMLIEGEKRASERGAVMWLVGLNPGVLDMVRHAGLDRRLGRERMLFNARAAIERYQAMQAAGAATTPATS